jgi:preprotein translocase subunit SecG
MFALSTVMAATLPVSFDKVMVNDVQLTTGATANTLSGVPGETIPVVVTLTANADKQDVKLKIYVEGYKSDIEVSTLRFDVVSGSTYVKRLALTLPSVEDMDNLTEKLTLRVRASDKTDDNESVYNIKIQRDAYSLQFLNIDAPSKAQAGEIIPVDVVLENIGMRDSSNSFVTVAIPELGVSKRVWLGDLYSQDDTEADQTNARERVAYVAIPSDAISGDYLLQVTASNYDATTVAKRTITIDGLAASDTNSTGTNVIKADTDSKAGMPTSVIVLTVVLVIIFVVLLIVLVVLLTKKPADKAEDFGETSYY